MSRRISFEQNGESGFTLIEAVIALALVTVVLAAIGSLVATNVRGARILEQHVALTETARLIASGIPHSGGPLPDEAGIGSVSLQMVNIKFDLQQACA